MFRAVGRVLLVDRPSRECRAAGGVDRLRPAQVFPMPQRTNEYQQVAARIQTALHAGVATVRESVMVDDNRAKTKTEIDILIEYDLGGQHYRTAVECRDRSRSADLNWIRELKTKREGCGLDGMIAVHSKGFSAAAIELAKAENIRTVTLERLEETDWPAAIGGYNALLFQYCHVVVTNPFYALPSPPQPFPVTGIRYLDEMLTLSQFTEAVKASVSERLLSETMPKTMEPPPPIAGEFMTVIDFQPGQAALLGAQEEWPISRVAIKTIVNSGWKRLAPASYLRSGDLLVQDSKTQAMGAEFKATVVAEPSGKTTIALSAIGATVNTAGPPGPIPNAKFFIQLLPVDQPPPSYDLT
jgi:hypothetical protein